MRQPNSPNPSTEKPKIEVVREEEPEGLQITWKDGLPDDPFERMQIETGLKAAGLTSTYSSIKRLLDGDDAATEEEMKKIREEQAESMLGEAALGVGMPPDLEDAQGTREQIMKEREEAKKFEKESAEKGADKKKRR